MVRVSLILLLACCTWTGAGCGPSPAPVNAERWGRALLWSLNQHHFDMVEPLLSSDARYTDASYAQPLHPTTDDRIKLGYYFRLLWRALPQLRWDFVRATGSDRTIVVEWVLHGYGEAAGEGLAGVYWLELSGDRISRIDAYFDGGRLRSALLAAPPARWPF